MIPKYYIYQLIELLAYLITPKNESYIIFDIFFFSFSFIILSVYVDNPCEV